MEVVDLFAGCGGMSLGFLRQGFEVLSAFENWDAAVKCHKENFHHPVVQMDLSDVNRAVEIIRGFRPDIIIGGPPCQDFSNAGKRVEGERADLTRCFAEIVSIIHPMCFVMENVPLAQKSKAYSKAREIFKGAGYGLTEIVLDASRCGVPQKRRRFICFGMLGKEDSFAMDLFTSRLAKKPMTVRDYVGNSFSVEFYYRHPRNYDCRAVFSIDEPAPTMRGGNPPVAKGYQGNLKDACPVTSKLRSLTYQERARIQTFPEDFVWVGKESDIETMIGNAVPVRLAEYVASIVRTAMTEDS